jgi:hypothetical protein
MEWNAQFEVRLRSDGELKSSASSIMAVGEKLEKRRARQSKYLLSI